MSVFGAFGPFADRLRCFPKRQPVCVCVCACVDSPEA